MTKPSTKKAEDTQRDSNPMRDSWKPEDKAAEAAIDNPGEFGQSSSTKRATVAPPARQGVSKGGSNESSQQ